MNKNIIMDWKTYTDYCYTLLGKIKQHGEKYDSIIAIMRGGYPIGLYLSNFLKIPLFVIQAQNNNYNEPERGEKRNGIEIGEVYGFGNVGKNILLIDDICDTGETITKVANYLQEKGFIVSLVSMVKRTINAPFHFSVKYWYWALEVNDNGWVIFPYEPAPEEIANGI